MLAISRFPLQLPIGMTAGYTLRRHAQGVPVGGELDYLDDGTLSAALKARRPF